MPFFADTALALGFVADAAGAAATGLGDAFPLPFTACFLAAGLASAGDGADRFLVAGAGVVDAGAAAFLVDAVFLVDAAFFVDAGLLGVTTVVVGAATAGASVALALGFALLLFLAGFVLAAAAAVAVLPFVVVSFFCTRRVDLSFCTDFTFFFFGLMGRDWRANMEIT